MGHMHITNIMYLIIIAPLSMYKGRRSRSFEEDFPHHNWFIVVLVLPFVSNTGYLMLTPSIYQFVTTPRSFPEELENTEVCGLSTVKKISLIKPLVIRACDLSCFFLPSFSLEGHCIVL